MKQHWTISLILISALAGCGPTAYEPEDGRIMTAARHAHYHVHGPGIDHDHSHADFPSGGHEHEHDGHGRHSQPPSP